MNLARKGNIINIAELILCCAAPLCLVSTFSALALAVVALPLSVAESASVDEPEIQVVDVSSSASVVAAASAVVLAAVVAATVVLAAVVAAAAAVVGAAAAVVAPVPVASFGAATSKMKSIAHSFMTNLNKCNRFVVVVLV